MENLVLYRKYRPQTFAEVVGQEHIIKTLTNSILAGKIAHAYLFTGSRGTGKTTVARLMAKAINCQTPKKFEPDNTCMACKSINFGQSMDIVEIDAASNRGIDEIRELKEGIRFNPSFLKYKVFIIDEVHMLTKEAFNALLKTLEEPPSHAIFILATTEIHKVPQTIISRCQRFDFKRLTVPQIADSLTKIAKAENIKVSKNILERIAQNSEGALRDAQGLLGQIISMSISKKDREINEDDALLLLGTIDTGAVIKLCQFIIAKDLPNALRFVNNLVDEGYDLTHFCQSMTIWLRKMLILKIDFTMADLIATDLTTEEKNIIKDQGEKMSLIDIQKAIKSVNIATGEVKTSILPQIPLELALIDIIS